MRRAVISRVIPLSAALSPPFQVNGPVLMQSGDHEFEASRDVVEQTRLQTMQKPDTSKVVPSASGIVLSPQYFCLFLAGSVKLLVL